MRFIYTKAFAIFFACLTLLAILVFMQYKGWLGPVRTAILHAPKPLALLADNIASPIKNFVSTIYQLKEISRENTRLSAEVSTLKIALVGSDQQARENENLRKELGFVKTSGQTLIPCTVLSTDPFGQNDGLVLNCGTEDGVTEGQAVISQGFLAGKVTYASRGSASVLMITSSNFSTDARISKTNQTAIVKGSFGSGLILDQVPQTSQLDKGSLVVTGGINEKIPKNIIIGDVSDILSSGNDLFKRASISSPIDFKNLDFVFVVK